MLIDKVLFSREVRDEFNKLRKRHDSALERNLELLKKVNGKTIKSDNETKGGDKDDTGKAKALCSQGNGSR